LPEKSFEAFAIAHNKNNEQLWNIHHEVIIAEHVKENPGTRPALWWQYTAPRLPLGTFKGWFIDGKLPQPRKRLGSTGTPAYEVTAVGPSFALGIPEICTGVDESDHQPTKAKPRF
ncbi:MAG TPA: hypothetical protein VFJ59_00035, partial [Pseudolabrys sp.]|nr:hypothetical protein [Pseudolabrys sp.]